MTIRFKTAWNGHETGQIITLDTMVEAALIASNLADVYLAPTFDLPTKLRFNGDGSLVGLVAQVPGGAESIVTPGGAAGPVGPASTVPGPAGPAGPAGAASTVAGPTGPTSTTPGPAGPAGAASTVAGPAGPAGASGAGAPVATVVAFAPAFPFDVVGFGKTSVEYTPTATVTVTLGAGAQEGGAYDVICKQSATGYPFNFPADWIKRGTDAFGATANKRTKFVGEYTGGTVVYALIPLADAVAAPTAPTFTAQAAPAGTIGVAYTYTFAATGAASYAVATGTLPTGVTLATATGVISGTPTTAQTAAFTISATNAAGTTASSAQSVVVAAAAAAAARTDNFTRANSLTTPNPPSDGLGLYRVDGLNSPVFGIAANAAYMVSNTANSSNGYVTWDRGSSSYTQSVTFTPDGSDHVGVMFRYVDTDNFFTIESGVGATFNLFLIKRVAGVSTNLGNTGGAAGDPFAANVPHTIVVTVTPAGFSVSIDGLNHAELSAASDATHSTATRAGFAANGNPGGSRITAMSTN